MLKSLYNAIASKSIPKQLEDNLRDDVLISQSGRCFEVQCYATTFDIYIYAFITLKDMGSNTDYPLFELDLNGLAIASINTTGYLDPDMTIPIDTYGYASKGVDEGVINFKCVSRPPSEYENTKLNIHIKLKSVEEEDGK